MISQKSKVITKNYCFNDEYLKWYLKYSEYLDTLNISNDTKDWRLKHIRGFIDYLIKKEIHYINLKIEDVHSYVVENLYNISSRTKENRTTCIRYYLNFLFEQHIIPFSGKNVFPKILSTKYSTIPSFYSDTEVTKIIKNASKTMFKKDYCIVLLFCLYGLRCKDVQQLTFDNIKWNDNKIILTQSKDNDINVLPLIKELKYSLIEYFKNERIKCNSNLIFVNKKGAMINTNKYYDIVSKAFSKADINTYNEHHGPQSLRHSLATSLLNAGLGLREISSVLNHDDINTTKIYATINMKDLKMISLEVPTWKN